MFYADPTNFGKPRKMDLLLSRQMVYDNTFEWIATQGWSFLPLDGYGGGHMEAQFRPLEENAFDCESLARDLAPGARARSGCCLLPCACATDDLAWAQYMGYGVAGVCWRGPQIFEGPLSKAVVTKWIAFYKKFRETLTSDMLIHVRRPDGQNVDAVLHANPGGATEKGLIFAFNPTDRPITANVSVNLYYTGLEITATVTPGSVDKLSTIAPPATAGGVAHTLRRDYSILVEISMPASGYAWWVVTA